MTENGESRTLFYREIELINRIQLRNVPVATATKNDIVLSHVVELTKKLVAKLTTRPKLVAYFRLAMN